MLGFFLPSLALLPVHYGKGLSGQAFWPKPVIIKNAVFWSTAALGILLYIL